MSEKPLPIKDTIIQHHKLGNIKLGKIPNNEKCRMIMQLLQEKHQLQNQLRAAVLIVNKIPEKTREKYVNQVKDDFEKAKNNKPTDNN